MEKEDSERLMADAIQLYEDHCSTTEMVREMTMMKCIGQIAGDAEINGKAVKQREVDAEPLETVVAEVDLFILMKMFMGGNGLENYLKYSNPLDH